MSTGASRIRKTDCPQRVLKLNQLEIFCKIVDLKSFSRAAEALHLSQPTLTEHIKSLEDYLGITLLDRLGREIVPTKAGVILYEYAKKISELKEAAEQKINGLKSGLNGSLLVGASTIPGEFILPRMIKSFRDKFPGISIHLKISDTKKVIDDILGNNIELGVVGAKIETQKLEYRKFVDDELILAGHHDYPFPQDKAFPLEKLGDIPFVLREEGSGTRMIMEKALKKHKFVGAKLNVISTLGSTNAVVQAIKSGAGCSILSRRAVQDELTNGTLKAITIEDIKMMRRFYMVARRRKSRSPLCATFFTFLLKKAKTDK